MDLPNDLNNWFIANWWIYIVIMVVGITLPIACSFVVGRGKIRVRIKSEIGEISRWVKPSLDGKLPLQKGSKKQPEWNPEITSGSIFRTRFLGRLIDTVEIIYGMPKTIRFDYKGKGVNAPPLTTAEVKRFAQLELWRKRYGTKPVTAPSLFWISILISGISIAVLLYFVFVQFPGAIQTLQQSPLINQTGRIP